MPILVVLALSLWARARGEGPRPPRAELHVHLDGSVPVETLWDLCKQRGVELRPGAGLPESPSAVASHLASLQAWRRFDVVNDIIGGDAAVIRDVAEAFVRFQALSGVLYTEVRYDPVRLARSRFAKSQLRLEDAVAAVQGGLAAGAARHRVAVYQILCAMRGQGAQQCFEVANLTKRMRSQAMGGVVAMDLAGDEASYPNGLYVECLRYAKRTLGLNTTVHAGEFSLALAGDVRSAVLEMGADRIGHGYAAAGDAATLALLRERRVHLELCPNSARRHGLLATLGAIKRAGLNFSLNTDDPASWMGNTTAAADEAIVRDELGFTSSDLRGAYQAGLTAAFGQVPAPLASVDSCTACKYVAGGLASSGSSAACIGACLAMAWDPPVAVICGAICTAIEQGACRQRGPDDCARALCKGVRLCSHDRLVVV